MRAQADGPSNINDSGCPVMIVAGASGFIGKELIARLLQRFPTAKIIALSRAAQRSNDPRIIPKSCDLFSLKSLEEAVPEKVDYAIYLVHSMGPTARLDQGSFSDYDLILADNFARATKDTGLKQLIYLSGLIPEGVKLSPHLQSRLEVEKVFLEYGLPTTIFRAGLILGEDGSSSQILIKLVKRLPIMLFPKWTQNLTTPIDLERVLSAFTEVISDLSHVGKVYDLAGCQPLSYMKMMIETAQEMGLKRRFFKVPFFTPTLSRLWVSLITNTPRNLVYPLIESLQHPMVARPSKIFSSQLAEVSFRDLLKKTSFKSKRGRTFFRFEAQRKTVRSVQRLNLPEGKNAEWIKDQYVSWLPRFMRPFIGVRQQGTLTTFSLFSTGLSLLEIDLSRTRSTPDRQLLYVTGGLLAARDNKGRLEFRVVRERRFVLAAIHEFKPSLPWFVYKFTQAKLHLFVMNAFSRHLSKFQSKES